MMTFRCMSLNFDTLTYTYVYYSNEEKHRQADTGLAGRQWGFGCDLE